jgi:hypothetical protein
VDIGAWLRELGLERYEPAYRASTTCPRGWPSDPSAGPLAELVLHAAGEPVVPATIVNLR